MKNIRIVTRRLPNGNIAKVYPFHISMEGLEKSIICKEDEDYDALVKCIMVCSIRLNVIVVIYIAVSNHGHVIILCESQRIADKYANEIKRIYSMWLSRKYKMKNTFSKTDTKAIYLDSDWYLRNALAYVPRNALDNCCNIDEYKWSGYRAMFADKSTPISGRAVADLSTREVEQILHTNCDLSKVQWIIEENGEIAPHSCCDFKYLEDAFNNDQVFYLRTIGNLNYAQMTNSLVDSPRQRQQDNELEKTVSDICQRWFKTDLADLCLEKKIRVIPYVFRTVKTGVPQLARVFGLDKKTISRILNIPHKEST